MNATETKAKKLYDTYTMAMIDFWFGRTTVEPNKQDYCYKNGWMFVDGQSFCVEAWYPNNQPDMD